MKLMLVAVLSYLSVLISAGEFNVSGSREPVTAVVSDDVILPCHLEPPRDVKNLTVEWKSNDSTVHVYRNRKDQLHDQEKKFRGRTSLFHDEMSRGNISLFLTNVTEQDAGNYSCFVRKPPLLKFANRQATNGTVTLIVEKTSEPHGGQTDNDKGDTGIGTRGIVAIVCVIAVVALLLSLLLYFRRRQQPRSSAK